MRSWSSLLLLGCALLTQAVPAAATPLRVPAKTGSKTLIEYVLLCGFENTALGGATLTGSSDHAGGVLSGIGSSGQDGVSVSLQGLSGCAFHMQTRPDRLSVADVGAGLRYKLFSLTGGPGAVGEALAALDFHVGDTQSSLSCVCPPRFATNQYVTVWRLGQVVLSRTVPAGSTAQLSSTSATTPTFTPDVMGGSYSVRRKGWDGTIKGRVCATASLHGDCSVTLAGQSVIGDEVSFEMEESIDAAITNPLYEHGGTATNPLFGRLYVVSPPGSSYSSITIGS